MTRKEALAAGSPTYRFNKPCAADGTYQRYTTTKKCVECENYAAAIKAGRINGQRGTAKQPRTANIWCDEMSDQRSESIRKAKAKNAKPKRFCIIVGCGKPHRALGLCHKHYQREWGKKHG